MINKINSCLKFINDRAKEKSTHQAVIYIAAIAGVFYGPDVFTQFDNLVAGASLIIGSATAIWQMLTKEKK
jgi:hypothetical protein